MTTLARAVAVGDNELIVNAPTGWTFPRYVKIDSELLRVGGQQYREGTTLVLSSAATAAHESGATVTDAGLPFDAAFLSATSSEGGGGVTVDNQVDPPEEVTTLIAPGAVVGGGSATLAGVLVDPGNVWEALTPVEIGYRIAYTDPTHGARVHVFEVTTGGTTDDEAGFAAFFSSPPYELQPGGVVNEDPVQWAYMGIVGALPAALPAFPVLPRGVTWTVGDGLAYVSSAAAADNEAVLVISDSTPLEIFRLYSSGDGDWTARNGGIISLKSAGDGAGEDVLLSIEDDEGNGGTINLLAGATAMISVENNGGTKGLAFFGGVAPTTQPQVPATPTEQDIVDALVALGLITQAAP